MIWISHLILSVLASACALSLSPLQGQENLQEKSSVGELLKAIDDTNIPFPQVTDRCIEISTCGYSQPIPLDQFSIEDPITINYTVRPLDRCVYTFNLPANYSFRIDARATTSNGFACGNHLRLQHFTAGYVVNETKLFCSGNFSGRVWNMDARLYDGNVSIILEGVTDSSNPSGVISISVYALPVTTFVRSCKCGIINVGDRITGGSNVRPHSVPYQAAIVSSYSNYFYCAGALISRNYVVTPADCVNGLNPNDIKVILGEHNLYVIDGEAYRSVFSITLHPDYKGNNSMNVAVLRLAVPAPMLSYINPICFPAPTSPINEGKTLFLTGWGLDSVYGYFSNILRTVTLTYASNCTAVRPAQFCAIPNNQTDVCKSDNGSPVMYTSSNSAFLLGLATSVSPNLCLADPKNPNVFIKLQDPSINNFVNNATDVNKCLP